MELKLQALIQSSDRAESTLKTFETGSEQFNKFLHWLKVRKKINPPQSMVLNNQQTKKWLQYTGRTLDSLYIDLILDPKNSKTIFQDLSFLFTEVKKEYTFHVGSSVVDYIWALIFACLVVFSYSYLVGVILDLYQTEHNVYEDNKKFLSKKLMTPEEFERYYREF